MAAFAKSWRRSDLNDVRFRGSADIHRRLLPIIFDAIDPDVWSGRALQENFDRVGGCAVYREPDQVELIARVTGGDPSRVGPVASELIEHNVDVLVPISPAAVQAVRSLTSTIPIVAHDLETDPNLARSGWN
jgi:hypothetical protein